MKRLVLIALATVSSLAMAAISNSEILGGWKSSTPVYSGNGMSVHLGLAFDAASNATLSSICTFPGGKVLEATVTVPAEVTDTEITMLGRADSQVVDGGYTCNVNIEKGTVPYTLENDTLRLTADGRTMEFVRR